MSSRWRGIGLTISCLAFENKWKQRPDWTRPARPRRCAALLRATKVSTSRLSCLFSSNLSQSNQSFCIWLTEFVRYLISRCFPVSMTQVISGIVMPANVRFESSTIPEQRRFLTRLCNVCGWIRLMIEWINDYFPSKMAYRWQFSGYLVPGFQTQLLDFRQESLNAEDTIQTPTEIQIAGAQTKCRSACEFLPFPA